MGTKSTRSSGTQHNPKGVTQGVTIVCTDSGDPVDCIEDSSGVRRLAVDANVSASIENVNVDLDYQEDSVHIGDPNTDTILRVNPDGSINTNVEVDAADGDNIAISDGTNTLGVNTDGSINVVLTQSNPGQLKSIYNEVTSVSNASLTTIQTYVAPVGKTTFLQKAVVSGTNIAEYTIEINSVVQDKLRTYFGSSLNSEFKFVDTGTGIQLTAGDVISIKVIHARPSVGDFNSRLQVVEV